MSKRVSNKKSVCREGVTYGRQRVRLGWRKRAIKQAQLLLKLQAAGLENTS